MQITCNNCFPPVKARLRESNLEKPQAASSRFDSGQVMMYWLPVLLISGAAASTWWEECSYIGDPHYTTFDGFRFDHMSASCEQLMVDYFDVLQGDKRVTLVSSNQRISGWSNRVSFAKYIRVLIGSTEVYVDKDTMKINNNVVEPQFGEMTCIPDGAPGHGDFCIYRSGAYRNILIENRLQIAVDDTDFYAGYIDIHIYIDQSLSRRVRGMCGDADGNSNNDESMVKEYIGSGAGIGDVVDCDDRRQPIPLTSCPSERKNAASTNCAIIPHSNVQCQRRLSSAELIAHQNNCMIDVCNVDDEKAHCSSVRAFIADCSPSPDEVERLSTQSGCLLSCPAGTEYNSCAPNCPELCYDDPELPCDNSVPCVESCVCKKGLVLDEGNCVSRADCGCRGGGKYYSPGDFAYNNDCSQLLKCEDGSLIPQQSGGCDLEVSKCVDDLTREGEKLCQCKTGFENNPADNSCEDIDECETGTALCDPVKSTCQNTRGSYDCQCKDGFVQDEDSEMCVCPEDKVEQMDGTCADPTTEPPETTVAASAVPDQDSGNKEKAGEGAPKANGDLVTDGKITSSNIKPWDSKPRSAQLLIDGRKDTKLPDCFHSRENQAEVQWVKFRYDEQKSFGDVQMLNRMKNSRRMNSYRVEVCQDDCKAGEGQECASGKDDVAAGKWAVHSCNGQSGNVVVISNYGHVDIPVHICEVLVYASENTSKSDEMPDNENSAEAILDIA